MCPLYAYSWWMLLMKGKIAGERRNIHNEEVIHICNSSFIIIESCKLMRMTFAGNVAFIQMVKFIHTLN
jgi:hypothetical protein